MQKSILVVEDEPAIQKILQEPLAAAGYRVAVASDGLQGITAFCAGAFDLVILDILLPKMDGYAVCRRIRQQSGVPILLLTALDAEDDQIRGFDLLADDYITKPFSVRLVLKRVEALLRRARPPQGAQAPCGEAPSLQGAQAPCGGTRPPQGAGRPPQGAAGSLQGAQTPRGGAGQAAGVIRRNGIALDEAGRQVFAAEKEVPLTYLEFEILRLLLKNPGRVFSRDDLLNLVWGYTCVADEKGVNFHIMNLRKKLGVDCIETVRGVGYKIAKEHQE